MTSTRKGLLRQASSPVLWHECWSCNNSINVYGIRLIPPPLLPSRLQYACAYFLEAILLFAFALLRVEKALFGGDFYSSFFVFRGRLVCALELWSRRYVGRDFFPIVWDAKNILRLGIGRRYVRVRDFSKRLVFWVPFALGLGFGERRYLEDGRGGVVVGPFLEWISNSDNSSRSNSNHETYYNRNHQ